ncbi:hypothetical protein J6590_026400 [Homalodisca vitripennis]|nr:hypothetical protein J6590_026400 [Homalodisca vitripennis]
MGHHRLPTEFPTFLKHQKERWTQYCQRCIKTLVDLVLTIHQNITGPYRTLVDLVLTIHQNITGPYRVSNIPKTSERTLDTILSKMYPDSGGPGANYTSEHHWPLQSFEHS